MAKYRYTTSGVCSREIEFEIDTDGMVHNVKFDGGCNGNTQGVSALAEGRKASELCECLQGIDCRGRGTSCPDQLAKAISTALNKHS